MRRLIFLLPLLLFGCATQANMIDLETEQDRAKLEQGQLNERLQAVEKALKDRLPGGQTDLVLKLDQLTTDLQALQGRLEETSHLASELSQRFDDQAFRMKELTGRIDMLDQQMIRMEASGPAESRKGPSEEAGTAQRPPEKSVVLPGRSVEKQKGGLSPSEAYGLAYNDYLKGNYDLALMGFQNFLGQFKGTSLAPDAQYWIGESYYAKKDYLKAIDAFQKVSADYPASNRIPSALLKTGYAYIELGDKERARTYLRKVVQAHPFSNEAGLAKNRLAELR